MVPFIQKRERKIPSQSSRCGVPHFLAAREIQEVEVAHLKLPRHKRNTAYLLRQISGFKLEAFPLSWPAPALSYGCPCWEYFKF